MPLRRDGAMGHNWTMLVLVDNYDSFTWNLVQCLGSLGQEISVYRNDAMSADALLCLRPTGIVISPGPADPDHAGICLELVVKAAERNVPLLGVCLGHQSIGQAFGGKVVRAPRPMHGKISDITHDGVGLFRSIPTPFAVTRYHSLVVDRPTLPACLNVTAETSDGLVMALSHREKPVYGIQFHPESIATEHGMTLLRNFTEMVG